MQRLESGKKQLDWRRQSESSKKKSRDVLDKPLSCMYLLVLSLSKLGERLSR